MIAALLLAQAVTGTPVPPRPPQDWTALPQLRFVGGSRLDTRLSLFVRDEVAAGRCAAAVQGSNGWTVRVDFAVLVDPRGRARTAVPRAIGCPTVEQYAAGALSRVLRDNLYPVDDAADGWGKTTLVFAWDK